MNEEIRLARVRDAINENVFHGTFSAISALFCGATASLMLGPVSWELLSMLGFCAVFALYAGWRFGKSFQYWHHNRKELKTDREKTD